MSVRSVRQYVCDECTKAAEIADADDGMPAGWRSVEVRISEAQDGKGIFVDSDVCSIDCARALLLKASTSVVGP